MKFLINFSFQVDFFFKTKKKMIFPSDIASVVLSKLSSFRNFRFIFDRGLVT